MTISHQAVALPMCLCRSVFLVAFKDDRCPKLVKFAQDSDMIQRECKV